jgi:RNA polymerase sigma-B factor
MQKNPLNKWDKTRVRELFIQYRETDDKSIRDELVRLHLNLVKFLANKFSNRGEPIDDLYQVGCMALVKAVERFDVSVGAEFTTYATPTIIGEIKRYFRDKGWAMRVPRRLQELKLAVTRVYETLTTTLERPPTVQEIAKQLNVTEEEVLEAQELGQSYKLFSLNSDFEDDDNAKLSNMLDYGSAARASRGSDGRVARHAASQPARTAGGVPAVLPEHDADRSGAAAGRVADARVTHPEAGARSHEGALDAAGCNGGSQGRCRLRTLDQYGKLTSFWGQPQPN